MLDPNFHPFPEILTERLILRRVEEHDAPRIFVMRSHPTTLKFLHRDPAPSEKAALDFINVVNANTDKNESIFWGIAEKTQPYFLLGTICLWNFAKENYCSEIGYALHPDETGKGYMREAAKPVIDYARQLGLHRLEAQIDPNNKASISLLRSFGFNQDGLLRENIFYKGEWFDSAIFSILFKENN